MTTPPTMSREQFVKRLTELCLKSGMDDFPKNETDQHILLKSAVLTIGNTGEMTEKEVSEKLEYWVKNIARIKFVDRVSMRRRLVDTGYLQRSNDGAVYQVAQPGPRPGLFDPAIDGLDLPAVMAAAREEMDRRKREYMEKSKRK